MDIKTSSWHYRLLNTFFSNTPRSLCPYFWKVVAAIAVATLLIGSVSAIVIGTGVLVLKLFGITMASGLVFFVGSPVVGIVTVVVGVSALIAFFELCDYIKEKNYKRRLDAYHKNKDVEKQPSLVMAFLKSKKEKICPSLKFID